MKLDFKKQKWFFISSSVKKRKVVFLNPVVRNICKDSFFKVAKENKFLLSAFIIMPEHIHLLSGAYNLKTTKEEMAKKYKGATSRRIFLGTPGLTQFSGPQFIGGTEN